VHARETTRIKKTTKTILRLTAKTIKTIFMFALTPDEAQCLRTKISTTNISTKSRTMSKVFTEKGLYMLATILKSKTATAVTKELKS
jgi:hypothetical protein